MELCHGLRKFPAITRWTMKAMYLKPTKPASSTPALTSAARSSKCMLHGFPSYQTDDMPTCSPQEAPYQPGLHASPAAPACLLEHWPVTLLFGSMRIEK